MSPKESLSGQVEMAEFADESVMPVAGQQKTTRFMVFFSLYIALAGWIYNFDLGQNTYMSPLEHG